MIVMIGIEFVAAGAGLVTIATGGVGLAAWLKKKRIAREESSRMVVNAWGSSRTPLKIEVIPLSYEIALHTQIPDISIHMRCINYLRHSVRLERLNVEYLRAVKKGR